jgi:hypothetical protein
MPDLCAPAISRLAMRGGLLHVCLAPMTGCGCGRIIRRARVGSSGSRDRAFRTDRQSDGAWSGEDPQPAMGCHRPRRAPFSVVMGAPGLSHPGPQAPALTLPRLRTEGAASTPKSILPGDYAASGLLRPRTLPGIDDRTGIRPIADGFGTTRFFGAGGFGASVGDSRVRHRPIRHPIRPTARVRPPRAGAARCVGAPEFTPR